nr:putative RNA dependent RNA polymerase [Ailanthus crinkle leaf associated bluner-like virus]
MSTILSDDARALCSNSMDAAPLSDLGVYPSVGPVSGGQGLHRDTSIDRFLADLPADDLDEFVPFEDDLPSGPLSSRSQTERSLPESGIYSGDDKDSSEIVVLSDIDAFLKSVDDMPDDIVEFIDDSDCSDESPRSSSFEVSDRDLHTICDNDLVNEFLEYCRKILSVALIECKQTKPVSSLSELEGHRYCLYNGDTFSLTSDVKSLAVATVQVSPHCSVLPELDYVSKSDDHRLRSYGMCRFSLTLAGPGCGKSFSLVSKVKSMRKTEVVVLTTTKSTCVELGSKLRGYSVYTCDSYVIHRSSLTADVVVIDECFLSHPGKLLYCVSLLNAKRCYLFGDALQIPFIDREQILDYPPEIMDYFPVSEVLTKSWRCPSDVCKVLSKHYYDKLLRPFDISPGLWSEIRPNDVSVSYTPISGVEDRKLCELYKYDMVLTFTQKEKQLVMSTHSVTVRTVHEFQGCECDNIAIVRIYPDSIPDHIYSSDPHCLVALSRHRVSLTYYSPTTENDLLYDLIKSCESEFNKGGAIVSLSSDRHLGLYKPPSRPVAAVPFNRGVFKFHDKSQRVYVCVGRTGDRPAVMYGSKFVFNRNKRFCRSTLSEAIAPYSHRLRGRNVTVNFNAFPHIDQGKVVKLFNKYGAEYVDFSSASDFVGFNTYDAAIVSALPHDAPCQEIDLPEVTIRKPIPSFELSYFGDPVRDIQCFLNHFFRNATFVNTNYDEVLFHMGDISFPIDRINLCRTSGFLQEPRFSRMRPVISSPCPHPQSITTRNALNSIAKRNANVPCLASVENIPKQVDDMLSLMLKLCPELRCDPVVVSSEAIENWLSSQPMSVGTRIVPDRAIYDLPLNVYDFALKRSPKPDLSEQANDTHHAVQTILHQEKYVNAVFCPIWNELRDRVVSSLDPKFKFMTLCDDQSFGETISKILPPSKTAGLNVYEFDMSKYDKSQGALILEFECALLQYIGVDPIFVEMWRSGHVLCQVRDHNCKISFRTIYQRKSGDASTYTGNTIALMIMLMDMMDPEQVAMGLFSGDDSLIFSYQDSSDVNYSLSAYRYNLECKLFDYNSKYFCSKFIIPFDDEWLVVPDPLKRAVKLGRFDLRNPEHVELYRISFKDNIKSYSIIPIHRAISDALCERYSDCRNYDCSAALLAMVFVSRDVKEFQNLFFSLPEDNICHDPSLPALEL